MSDIVRVRSFDEPIIDRREILRYAKTKSETPEISALLDECLNELKGRYTYKLCYTVCDVNIDGNNIDLGGLSCGSAALAKNLRGCDRAVIFAATVGLEADRLIARYSHLSPSKALLVQAVGAERIEALCDAFEDELRREGHTLRPRFSPGYGDLDIAFQRDIFALLDCKRIGLTLNESLLMSPSKSVTAVIGIEKK